MSIAVAVIGMGKFGRLRHRILSEHPDVVVKTFFDPHLPSYEGRQGAGSADEILLDRSIDAVVIAVPNVHAKELVVKAIGHGKHVLCEKPPGVSLAEAQAMHAAQQQRPELKVKFGFNHRGMSHYTRLREIVRSEEYGKVLWIRGLYGKGYDAQFLNGWRSDPRLSGGGILLDQGIHLLDLVLHLFDGVVVEYAMVDRLKQDGPDLEDNVFALLRSTSGVPISVHSSIVQWKHTLRLEVGTENALLVVEGIKSSTRSFGDEVLIVHSKWHNNFVETHTVARNEPDFYTLSMECQAFVEAIRTGGPIESGTTADAVALMQVASDIYQFRKVG